MSDQAAPTTPEPKAPSPTTSSSPQSNEPSTDLGAEEAEAVDLAGTEDAPEAEGTALGRDGPDLYEDYRGPPETGEYEPFQLPSGVEIDNDLQGEFVGVAKEIGLSQKGAQRLVDFKEKIDQRARQAWGNHVAQLGKAAKADPEIGGSRYDTSIKAGRNVIARFGTPGLRKVMTDYGVGNHPEMIRFMARIHSAVSETPVLSNGGGSGVDKSNLPLHEKLYKD